MEITILEQQVQKALQRSSIRARVFFTQETPTRLAVAQALAKELGVDNDLLVVDTIDTKFGKTEAHIQARLYKDKKSMTVLERANLLEKHKQPAKEAEAAE